MNAASSLQQVVDAKVCSVCEGREDDHTGCANAVQHFLGLADAERARLREALERIASPRNIGGRDALKSIAKEALRA